MTKKEYPKLPRKQFAYDDVAAKPATEPPLPPSEVAR
eukprot:CAMPEP_0181110222 /NCGR_PEP_ID=MMETSP1071-20121207/18602_1 /TAXON_ID=35127 /ORGANISM="Thalassiosira sp., Strain NH16" /LENGTH=36 /DNA_ID= /DNA_START= /DNA_END= /DNA_ORIENTATION=